MTQPRKRFSRFSQSDVFAQLGIRQPQPWQLPAHHRIPSPFLQERLNRLAVFAIHGSESGKELLIDAFLEEAATHHPQLYIWKEPFLQSDVAYGYVDYLIAVRAYTLQHPLLCVVEAKKDDFSQGLLQCLIEMHACRWQNTQAGLDQSVYGIVSNGHAWQFYQLRENQVLESATYGTANQADLLGALDYMLGECEKLIRRGDATVTQI
jgi:hypothetical protein